MRGCERPSSVLVSSSSGNLVIVSVLIVVVLSSWKGCESFEVGGSLNDGWWRVSLSYHVLSMESSGPFGTFRMSIVVRKLLCIVFFRSLSFRSSLSSVF